ncbi:MAG: bifunctional [glutamate--ammonia ligase]-adenylyl-L-tyrosine phosphorylase/[glutamate--ammonia-ligase] adenylyltransferase [Woeseiaceae bacterium]|nr:bifunctional [glutamate--ammonia ligase]-adenylyl-L-tyrosine phosphorylase/[glutamate--ammonia-ligase] adenylyltransferase [Woeseiaceae bacterium]
MAGTVSNSYSDAIAALPGALQEPSALWFERLESQHAPLTLSGDVADRLVRLVACSEFAAGVVLRDWDWFVTHCDAFCEPPDRRALQEFVADVATSIDDMDTAKARIRRFRHRWMLHLLWREVSGQARLEETLALTSELADGLLDAAARFGERQMHDRYGVVRNAANEPVSLVILGMGKLGGHELNFSSDIDLIFVYPDAGDSDGRKSVSAQEYFTRVSRHIVALLDEVTADGFAFRVDTRLRPFGDSGPPVTSFAALESYLLQHGRDWERYAYVKARIVGPEPSPAIADELQQELITPFVFRRYLDFGVFESLREMHRMISVEVEKREMADNVKLGPGGIREIEFIAQSLQLVRGGSRRELQERQLLVVLPRLVGRHGLDAVEADALADAYRFLRRLENFIQAIRDRQTHDLPANDTDRERLRLAMGFASWSALAARIDEVRRTVSDAFGAIAFRDTRESGEAPRLRLAELWENAAAEELWEQALEQQGFAGAGPIAQQLAAFAAAPATRQVDVVASQRLQVFMPQLILEIRDCNEPATALSRVLGIVERILRRSAYLALLNENARVLTRLVRLCDQSSYIAEEIARYPVLLDELLDPTVHSSPLALDELDAELAARLAECDAGDTEARISALGQFQRANQFRVAIADVGGHLPIMKVSDSLSWLAEAVLKQVLRITWQDLTSKHGEPHYVLDGKQHKAGFAIIAYGKLGGLEMSYGSDLDLVFLHDSTGTRRETTGDRPLDNAVFFTRLVRRLSHFLTAQTGSGMLYEVDTRLRPDGQSGVMVSSIEAFERYQEDNAWTWEHQALLRARPVAGSAAIAAAFNRVRAETLSQRVRRDSLQDDVQGMRKRMRANLDKSGEDVFDLKQGAGGIGDIEFIVQYLVLSNAAADPEVYFYSDNIRQLDALAAGGFIETDIANRLQDVYRDYRRSLHHLALDDRQPLVGKDEFAAERRYVEDLWKQVL